MPAVTGAKQKGFQQKRVTGKLPKKGQLEGVGRTWILKKIV